MKRYTSWLAALAIVFIVFGTVYAAVQQSQRGAANYPQVQLAEDTAAALDGGSQPAALVSGTVHMDRSLAPFTIIYDRSGDVVAGSGYLNGAVPVVPLGVLQAAQHKEYHTVTWQPQNDVRVAAVSVAAGKYYVLSGRSLKEVEKQEARTQMLTAAGLGLSLATAGLFLVIGQRRSLR